MSALNPLISVNNVVRRFSEGEAEHRVLAGASFDVQAGQCIALLGQSGSGKSTLLNLLGGIDRPDGGELWVAGRNLAELGEPELTLFRRKTIGYVYQFFNLIPTLTVCENVELPLELLGIAPRLRKQRVDQWLQRVELAGRGHAFPDQLSGGEQQRVAIARALVHEPEIVLADEPTGNLDAETGHRVLDRLTSLSRDLGRTLIIVTHSREVVRVADRVLELRDGLVQESGVAAAW